MSSTSASTTPRPRPPSTPRRHVAAQEAEVKTPFSVKDMMVGTQSFPQTPPGSASQHYSVNKIVKKLTQATPSPTATEGRYSAGSLSIGTEHHGRDISYLTDRQHHGYYMPKRPGSAPDSVVNLPSSKMPKQFQVSQICMDPATARGSYWDDDKKTWQQVVFPSLIPAGRSEVLLLEDCFDQMLSDWEQKTKSDASDKILSIEDFEAAKKIYVTCFSEIVRQVSVQCVERGRLLTRMWNAFVGINDRQRQYILNLMDQLQSQLSTVSKDHHTSAQNFHVASIDYANEIRRLKNALEKLSADNDDLMAKYQHTKKIADDAAQWKEANERSLEIQAKYQELLDRLHEYTEVLRETNVDTTPSLPQMGGNGRGKEDFDIAKIDGSDDFKSSKGYGLEGGPYNRLPIYRKDMDYLKNLVRMQKKKQELEAAARLERQKQWERVNENLLEELARLRKLHGEKLSVETYEVSTQTYNDEKVQEAGREESTENDSETETQSVAEPAQSADKPKGLQNWKPFVNQKLMTKLWKGNGTPLPIKALLKLISNIYQEKMGADEIDDREHHTRQPMPEFIYDFFINKYGLRNLAENHVVNLLASLNKYRNENVRVQVFANFCGVLPKEVSYPRSAVDFYLTVYRKVLTSQIGTSFAETEDGILYVVLPRALQIFTIVFHQMDPDLSQMVQQKITSMATDISEELTTLVVVKARKPGEDTESVTFRPGRKKTTSEKVVDMDRFFMICLEEWFNENERNSKYMEAMFHASDVSGDGFLQTNEFRALIQYVDPFCTERQINRIYSDAVRHSDIGIDLENFLRVAKEYGFGAGIHTTGTTSTEKAFNLLSQNWSMSESIVEFGIKFCRDNGKLDVVERILTRKERFFKLYRERADAESAWIAFKMLMVDVANVKRYNVQERKQFVVQPLQAPTPPNRRRSSAMRSSNSTPQPPEDSSSAAATPKPISE